MQSLTDCITRERATYSLTAGVNTAKLFATQVSSEGVRLQEEYIQEGKVGTTKIEVAPGEPER